MLLRTIERRAAMLAASDNESARACADDALACLARFERSEPHPWGRRAAGRPIAGTLPTTWVESAAAWITRGAQHAYGYRLPENW